MRWLFGDADRRRIARRYWLRDPVVGAAEIVLHYAMRAMPIDMCSYSGAAITYLTRRLYPESEARARKAVDGAAPRGGRCPIGRCGDGPAVAQCRAHDA